MLAFNGSIQALTHEACWLYLRFMRNNQLRGLVQSHEYVLNKYGEDYRYSYAQSMCSHCLCEPGLAIMSRSKVGKQRKNVEPQSLENASNSAS